MLPTALHGGYREGEDAKWFVEALVFVSLPLYIYGGAATSGGVATEELPFPLSPGRTYGE